jgi:hypothetical protein
MILIAIGDVIRTGTGSLEFWKEGRGRTGRLWGFECPPLECESGWISTGIEGIAEAREWCREVEVDLLFPNL